MAQKMTGALVFDERTDRYDIRFDLNSYYGGLHCGECFDVFVRGKWKPTRIEYGDNWYLVGIRAEACHKLDETEYYLNILCVGDSHERAEVVQQQMADGKLDRLRQRLEIIHKEEIEDGYDTAGVA